MLTACGQGSDPQQGVISDDKLSAPLPKAITALLVDDTNLIVDVVLNERIGGLLIVLAGWYAARHQMRGSGSARA